MRGGNGFHKNAENFFDPYQWVSEVPRKVFYLCIMKGLLLILLLFITTGSFAQVASGKVLDRNQKPIVGTVVFETGTTNGVFSDDRGNFSLRISGEATSVTFRYAGMKTVVVPIEDASHNYSIEVVMDRKKKKSGYQIFAAPVK